MSLSDCHIVELPVVHDERGNLTFAEGDRHLPFAFRRVFYLYDVPGGSRRAGHALKSCHQFLIAISGSFDVVLDDGSAQQRFHLNRSYYGLHVTPLTWRELDNFSSNAVCLVLASEAYNPDDYYRDYESYLTAVRRGEE
jgi:WxcM-like, C-terminal